MQNNKINNSAALVITWITQTGLIFEYTELYVSCISETGLIKDWTGSLMEGLMEINKNNVKTISE
eukprot:8146391-Ditylum_brightwellii.AAC.1